MSLSRLWQAVDGVHHEVEAVQIVQRRCVEGRGDGALFLVAADVDVVVVDAAVGQPVDQPRVRMEGEDDRLVLGTGQQGTTPIYSVEYRGWVR
jgi:hypothetical protein